MDLMSRGYANSAIALRPGNLLCECNLVEVIFRPGTQKPAVYRAPLDDSPIEFVDFDIWWNTPVMTDQIHPPISRREIVTFIANQDGGAHVDNGIDAAFEAIRKDGFKWTDGRNVTNFADRYAVRQIGHELLKSLKPEYRRQNGLNEANVSIWAPLFREAGLPPVHPIAGYQDTNGDDPCPCRSGERFANCHEQGSAQPRNRDMQQTTMQAPDGAVSAKLGVGIQPH